MLEIVQSTASSMPPKETHDRVMAGKSLIILDVREPDEWADGVIESATLLSCGRIDGRLEELVSDKNAAIVIHLGALNDPPWQSRQ